LSASIEKERVVAAMAVAKKTGKLIKVHLSGKPKGAKVILCEIECYGRSHAQQRHCAESNHDRGYNRTLEAQKQVGDYLERSA
jgi:hypothetical protein